MSPQRAQSDQVHEDLILHDAGDLRHPGLRDGSSLTSGHQHLTCTRVQGGEEREEERFRGGIFFISSRIMLISVLKHFKAVKVSFFVFFKCFVLFSECWVFSIYDFWSFKSFWLFVWTLYTLEYSGNFTFSCVLFFKLQSRHLHPFIKWGRST